MGEVTKRAKVLLIAALAVAGSLATTVSATAGPAQPGDTFPISYLTPPPGSTPGSESGVMGPGYISSPVTPDGRYVFFASNSDNLAPGSDPEVTNVFRKDRQTGDVVLVSLDVDGAPFLDYVYDFEPSADGNLVVMVTEAKGSPSDTDENADLYLRNIAAGTTTLLTPGITSDVEGAAISADGAYVAFSTNQALTAGDANPVYDVYRMRLSDSSIKIVSAINATTTAGNERSYSPSISGDGTWVAFASEATNLIGGFVDGNPGSSSDVWVRNVETNATHLVSTRYNSPTVSANDGSEEPVIAGSPALIGEVKVAFTSYATNVADNSVIDPSDSASVYLKPMPNTASALISRADGPAGANADSRAHTPSVSDDGTRVVFSSDAQNLGPNPDYYAVYLRDLTASSTKMISARSEYAVQGFISGDGSTATWGESGGATADSDPDLASVFARTLPEGSIELISRPKGTQIVRAAGFQSYDSQDRTISADGRYFVFSTYSKHLPEAPSGSDTQMVYRRDLTTGEVELVARASGATGAIAKSAINPTISSDGNKVAFIAYSSMDPADPGEDGDVYVRDMTTKTTTLVSRGDGANGPASDNPSGQAVISGDGDHVAFVSHATNLGAPGGHPNVFLRSLSAGKTVIISRATGELGPVADAESKSPSISYDGSKVAFESYATNLHPDDALNSQSIFIRDLGTNETQLASRSPGLAGASVTGYTYGPVISGDGGRIAFLTYDQAAVPDSGAWPVGVTQLVVRDLADGTNRLASVSSTGQAGDGSSTQPSFSRDGNVIAFETSADNLRNDIANTASRDIVIRDLTNGTNTGPPSFGLRKDVGYSERPVVSDNGQCVSFDAKGHNALSGDLGDLYSDYMYARGTGCVNPRILVPTSPVPTLTAVSFKPTKFRVSGKQTAKVAAKKKRKKPKAPKGTRIRFTLNTTATVIIQIDRKVPGRKAGKKCVKQTKKNKRKKACLRYVRAGQLTRNDQAAGSRVVPFSGRIGKRKLQPGRYRAILQGIGPAGKSAKVYRSFKVVKR